MLFAGPTRRRRLPMSDTVIPTAEAARRLGISSSTLEKLRSRNLGPPVVRITARRVGYLPASIDAYLREREERPREGPSAAA
jgi:predicted DNA-binding transcriptional regulator AlpA